MKVYSYRLFSGEKLEGELKSINKDEVTVEINGVEEKHLMSTFHIGLEDYVELLKGLQSSVGDFLPDVALLLSKQGNEGEARATLPACSATNVADKVSPPTCNWEYYDYPENKFSFEPQCAEGKNHPFEFYGEKFPKEYRFCHCCGKLINIIQPAMEED